MIEFVRKLLEHETLAPMIVHHRLVPGRQAAYAEPRDPLPGVLSEALASNGIDRLYTHQAAALDEARAGRNVLAVTPTASGKSLIFALPVLESILREPGTRALFLYPTKALAQDQVAGLRSLAMSASPLHPPRFEIYDGDTPASERRKIKADPPDVLITNPDMLHFGLLAYHQDWERFLGSLRWVVLDELHVYRGLFGAHVHHILKRLRRICGKAGASPAFIAASATMGNPEEFSSLLTGDEFSIVQASGAPIAPRHVVFLNPVASSPYTVAVRTVSEAARAGMRTIAFTKARRVTELLHTWIARQAPSLAGKVAPYRAGYLPAERREIEERLFRGDLLAVLTTSALELGIDVGDLDVCVLVGYPGSLMSSWQRIGRVGRKDREAVVVMVAMPDTLDQYIVAHPDLFFGEAFERAVLDPRNRLVAGGHMVCAAAEDPLREGDLDGDRDGRSLASDLVRDGRLVEDSAGTQWFSLRRRPHRDVNPRSAGRPYTIEESGTGRVLGSIDGMRVYHECHQDAVYLHGGRSYRVVKLDEEGNRVSVVSAMVDYYTVVLGEKETEILERLDSRSLNGFKVGLGRLKVTVHIRGYQKKSLFGGEVISEHPLSAPPLIFETVGFWIELPVEWPAAFTAEEMHFMGGIHATEHAVIGLFPLLAIADRGDVGGISYTNHPQTGTPAVFVYDAVPGGAGLAEQGFRDPEMLFRRTFEHVSACECEEGCPSCIHSPKCGNGNKPLDKKACILVLAAVLGEKRIAVREGYGKLSAEQPARPAPEVTRPRRKHGITRAPTPPVSAPSGDRVLVFDLETQRSAEEVGGWSRIEKMGLALAVTYDMAGDAYRTYLEQDVDRLLLDLVMADLVVGFNVDRFDLRVLSAYTDWNLDRIRTCDMLAEIHRRLGFRLSLQHLAQVNLGESKSADGLQSLAWWKEGKIDLIEEYCRKDVEVTRRLYEIGRDRNYLLYLDHAGREVKVPVDW